MNLRPTTIKFSLEILTGGMTKQEDVKRSSCIFLYILLNIYNLKIISRMFLTEITTRFFARRFEVFKV